MNAQQNFLFDGGSVHGLIAHMHAAAMNELKGYNENIILCTPADDLVARIIERQTPHIPELRDIETHIDDKEMVQTFTDDDYGRHTTRSVISHFVTFHIPFDGDGGFFTIQPSSRSIPGPAADVRGQYLEITIASGQKSKEELQMAYLSEIKSIKQHLGTLKNDIRDVAGQIETSARAYIGQRKEQLLKSKNLVASLGFPMKRRADAPATFHAPEVRRRVAPVKSEATAPFSPEPALSESEYLHILGVMDNMTKVMERSPHTFQGMGEEDIRQHFLVQLNGQYEGQATGETFNYQGKTDILVRSEGKNIFIAECKFWHGENGFSETVDQLLSYLSWRDSKTAVVVFNKNKNLTGVLNAIKGSMEKHPHKKRGPKIESDTRFRYVMGNPNDHAREISLTVMVYDIPVVV